MIDLTALAESVGFADCFTLTTEPFDHYKRRLRDGVLESAGQALVADPQAAYPWANAILFLPMAYRPYAPSSHVSGNYPSSNRAYHAVKQLIPLLERAGVRAERVYVPVRELAMRSGVGVACKNGLTAYGALGTRVAVQTLIAFVPDVAYTRPRYDAPFAKECEACHACGQVCPSRAIGDGGYDFQSCARAYMGKGTMPGWTMDAMTSLLGCELCQFVCPLNRDVPIDPELPEAFDLGRILGGEVKPVLEIVGTNLNSGGRILCHAAVMAGKLHRTDLLPQLTALLSDPREQVRTAAKYAIFLLQSHAHMI